MSGAGGRPTKYSAEYCETARAMLKEGKSVTQFAAHIGVSRSTVYLWATNNQEFSDALSLGQEFSEAYWETQLQDMMYDRNVNAPLVKLYFANRFNWSDKSHQDHTSSDGSMSPTRIELVAPSDDS